ncbi:unnamed protein product [Symbiodinium sp. KB8]|nr:unnamed protein product [Symbiodinium sp. KB8]
MVAIEQRGQRRYYLASEGLVYRAVGGSKVTNCSQAALTTLGEASAAGAEAAPPLAWLQERLASLPEEEGGGPHAFVRLVRRLRRLAAHLQPCLDAAASQRTGEVPSANVWAALRVPKILGLDVIVTKTTPEGGVGPWPWLLEAALALVPSVVFSESFPGAWPACSQ